MELTVAHFAADVLGRRLIKIKHLANKRFQKLFFKYCGLVMAAVVLPLIAAVLSLYFFSNRLLLSETDNANYRGLENTKSTLDAIFLDTESMIYRHITTEDVQAFVSANKDIHPDYNYISAANRILKLMQAGRRSYLDHDIAIYSDVSDYFLATQSGGQSEIGHLYPEKIDHYSSATLTEKGDYFSARWSAAYPWSDPVPLLTIYRPIPTLYNTPGSFIAVDIDQRKLTNYLMDATSNHQATVLIVDDEGGILYNSTLFPDDSDSRQISGYWNGEEGLSEVFFDQQEGSFTLRNSNSASRLSWVKASGYNLKYVQIVPFDDYMVGMRELRRVLVLVILIGVFIAVGIAYSVTRRMFRPLGDILHAVENPAEFSGASTKDDEIQFLLMNILESFQKNMTLEEEMISRKIALRGARAKALQEQITPHFLYNSLQSIHWLAIAETQLEESRTSAAIITLSSLVRACMEESGNLVAVREELDYIRHFMSMEQLRYGEGIQYHIAAEEEVMEHKMLRLSLQPLVENAV
ncbi:MAG: sensor histidine kinase, partial [Oscillospiraceae bacterium]